METEKMAGAEYLQSIFGTEKDKVNCPFYFKIGACRYGDKCGRRHNKPTLSQTLLIVSMFQNPALLPNFDEKKAQRTFEDFYEDIFEELSTYGDIEELYVCDNVCDHMQGNVYVKYYSEDSAEKAIKALIGRFYGGKPIVAEFSPVTDFRESSCRQYEMHECTRGGHCNFMHLREVPRDLKRRLFGGKKKRRSRSRSPRRHSRSPRKQRKRSRSRSRSPKPRVKKEEKEYQSRSTSRDKEYQSRSASREREKEKKRKKSP